MSLSSALSASRRAAPSSAGKTKTTLIRPLPPHALVASQLHALAAGEVEMMSLEAQARGRLPTLRSLSCTELMAATHGAALIGARVSH